MNAMTCQEVQDQIDLLAAGACDPPTRAALEGHLQQCPACAAGYAESQRVLGLLDLHFGQAGVERLQQRIAEEARPRKKRIFTPFVGRAALVAAVFLVALGLNWWIPKGDRDQKGPEPQFALLVHAGKPRLKDDPQPPAPLTANGAEAVAVVPLAVRSGDAFRRELSQAQRDGKLPLPPEVFLELLLVNTGTRPVEVRLGDTAAELSLELPDDGVIHIPAPAGEKPDFLRPQTLQLAPGKQQAIHIDRLIAGSSGKLEYIYLTEPGEYLLTARLTLTADGRVVTVTGEKVRIKVGN
jgi:hypothetical protein